MRFLLRGVLLPVFVLCVGCPHPHSDHEAEKPSSEKEDEHPSVAHTVFTDRIELFVEHPVPVQSTPIEFLAHFTILATGRPVTEGALDVVAIGGDGREHRARAEQPRRAGLFVPTLTLDSAGEYRLRLDLTGPQADSFDLGALTVFADETAARAATPEEDEDHDALTFLLEQQWRIGMLIHQVEPRRLVERVQVPARVVPRHGHAAHVTPPVAGSVVAPEGGLPELGEWVEKGRLLAWIRPPLPITEAASLAANRIQVRSWRRDLLLRRTELSVRLAELSAARGPLGASIEFAQRALARTQTLFDKGLATDQEVDAARGTLAVAEAELSGNLALADEVKDALQVLSTLERDAGDDLSGAPDDPSDASLLPLYAPIDGMLARAECIGGQFFEASETVFEIVDSRVVWVEARVPEFDLPKLSDAPSALLRIPGHDEFLLDLSAVDGAGLVHVAPLVDTATHSAPLLFEVPNPGGRLRIGMSLDVYLETSSRHDAVAIPKESVIKEAGQSVAYVLAGGETFEKRYLTLGIEDGGMVAVLDGVSAGERVVSRGAYTLRLASLAPESVAEHTHHH